MVIRRHVSSGKAATLQRRIASTQRICTVAVLENPPHLLPDDHLSNGFSVRRV